MRIGRTDFEPPGPEPAGLSRVGDCQRVKPVLTQADRARSIAAKISSSSGKRNCFSLEKTSVPSSRTSKAPPLPSMSLETSPYLSLIAFCKLAASGR